jgi:hypothetical protein
VQEPQEGRWSLRRRTSPVAIDTLRSSNGLRRPKQARERRSLGSRRPSQAGKDPWRGEAQGSSGTFVGITPRACNGLPEGVKAQKPHEDRGAKPRAVRVNVRWARIRREAGSLSAKGKAPKGEAHERARHETRPWSSGEKQSVKRADEP